MYDALRLIYFQSFSNVVNQTMSINKTQTENTKQNKYTGMLLDLLTLQLVFNLSPYDLN